MKPAPIGWRVALLLWAAIAPPAGAVLFRYTADPAYNTNAPSGALTNSGWQWEGRWAGSNVWDRFLGTPIAPRFFIAAQHVNNGDTNWTFQLNGYTYHPVAFTNHPTADLTVWEVAETFPAYALLYDRSDEVGQHCVVFGRGTQRGPAVLVDGITNGWRWGASDYVERWGENDIASLEDLGAGEGQMLRATFDATGGVNECHLSVGDSSGGLFIQDGATWKLAGIHHAVDGYFSTNGAASNQFDAALLDMGGLWSGAGTNWSYVTNELANIPSAFYSTRISAYRDWITSVINFLPGPDLQILDFQLAGADAQLRLATASNRYYRVEYADDPAAGAWTVFTNQVPGTGSPVLVVDPGAVTNAARRYYRAALEP